MMDEQILAAAIRVVQAWPLTTLDERILDMRDLLRTAGLLDERSRPTAVAQEVLAKRRDPLLPTQPDGAPAPERAA